MKWKVKEEINHGSNVIPKGSVLEQVNHLGIETKIKNTISSINKMNPYKKLVVCRFNNSQHIFEVGKDVIPYGRGVI